MIALLCAWLPRRPLPGQDARELIAVGRTLRSTGSSEGNRPVWWARSWRRSPTPCHAGRTRASPLPRVHHSPTSLWNAQSPGSSRRDLRWQRTRAPWCLVPRAHPSACSGFRPIGRTTLVAAMVGTAPSPDSRRLMRLRTNSSRTASNPGKTCPFGGLHADMACFRLERAIAVPPPPISVVRHGSAGDLGGVAAHAGPNPDGAGVVSHPRERHGRTATAPRR